MANKKKGASISMDIKGVSIKKLLNIDMNTLNRMDVNTLGAVTKRLVNLANRRISNLEKQNVQHLSSAYVQRRQNVKKELREQRKAEKKARGKSGTTPKIRGRGKGRPKLSKLSIKFKVNDTSRNKLLQTMAEVKKFLDSATSTPEGVKRVQKSIIEAVGRNLTKSESKRMWKIYNELLKGEDGEYGNIIEVMKQKGYGSQQIINDIAKRVARRKYKDEGIDKYQKTQDILDYWKNKLDAQYQKFQQSNANAMSTQYNQKEIEDPDATEQGDATQG